MSVQPIRPTSLDNGLTVPNATQQTTRGDWTPEAPVNTPNLESKIAIIVSQPESEVATSQIATDSDSNVDTSKAEDGTLSSTQIVVDSAEFSTPVGEKIATTITSTSTKVENRDDEDGHFSSQTITVTSTESTEFHSVTSESKVIVLSSSEEPIDEDVSQIVNEAFKSVTEIAEAETTTDVTESIDAIQTTQESVVADGAPEPVSSEAITFPASFAKLRSEDRSSTPEHAVVGSQFVTTQDIENGASDLGISSPGLVEEVISSKVEIIPSETGEDELVSSSVTKETSSFVELSNGFRKEETTSTVTVISSQSESFPPVYVSASPPKPLVSWLNSLETTTSPSKPLSSGSVTYPASFAKFRTTETSDKPEFPSQYLYFNNDDHSSFDVD